MKATFRSILLPLFTLAMVVFLVLAFIIVFTQIAGILFAQGAWIDAARESLSQPSIIAAIAVGILGYCYYTTVDKDGKDED